MSGHRSLPVLKRRSPSVLRPTPPAPRASFLRDAACDSNHLDAGHGRLFYTRMHSLSAARRVPRKLVRGRGQDTQVGKARRWQARKLIPPWKPKTF